MFMFGIVGGFLCTLTVGYAAFSTNITLNAKGTIKKNKMPITIDELKEQTEIPESGLYEDIYEEGRYIYKGETPNNIITLNNDKYYIIAIEQDNSLKVRKKEKLEDRAWDTTNKNTWSSATLNTYLNDTYYKSLPEELKNIIVEHTWPVGMVVYNNSDLENQIASEKSTLFTANVGLMTLSDYYRANTDMALCGNFSLNQTSNETCKLTNYLEPLVGNVWTITANQYNQQQSFRINIYGGVWYENTTSSMGVYPTYYLSPDIKLLGKGTEEDSYIIQ